MILSTAKQPGPGSVLVKEGRAATMLFRLSPESLKELRQVAKHIDVDAADALDFMVKAFADCEAMRSVFSGYIIEELTGRRYRNLPLEGVAVTEGHFIKSFVEGDFEKNLATLERRWSMNGGKVLSVALRLAVEYFQAEAARRACDVEEIPF